MVLYQLLKAQSNRGIRAGKSGYDGRHSGGGFGGGGDDRRVVVLHLVVIWSIPRVVNYESEIWSQ